MHNVTRDEPRRIEEGDLATIYARCRSTHSVTGRSYVVIGSQSATADETVRLHLTSCALEHLSMHTTLEIRMHVRGGLVSCLSRMRNDVEISRTGAPERSVFIRIPAVAFLMLTVINRLTFARNTSFSSPHSPRCPTLLRTLTFRLAASLLAASSSTSSTMCKLPSLMAITDVQRAQDRCQLQAPVYRRQDECTGQEAHLCRIWLPPHHQGLHVRTCVAFRGRFRPRKAAHLSSGLS